MRYFTFPEWRLSPNGKWLARVDPVATKSTTKVQWQEVATGKVVATIEAAKCELSTNLSFRPTASDFRGHCGSGAGEFKSYAARRAIGAKEEHGPAVIRMWDVATQREVRTFALPALSKETFWPRRFAFSPNGANLAASGFGGGNNGVVRVWEVAGEKPSVEPWPASRMMVTAQLQLPSRPTAKPSPRFMTASSVSGIPKRASSSRCWRITTRAAPFWNSRRPAAAWSPASRTIATAVDQNGFRCGMPTPARSLRCRRTNRWALCSRQAATRSSWRNATPKFMAASSSATAPPGKVKHSIRFEVEKGIS